MSANKTKTLKEIVRNQGVIKGIFAILKYRLPTPLNGYISLLETEINNRYPVELTIKQRIKAFTLGFTSQEYCYYGIKTGIDPKLYLSELDRFTYTRNINKNPNILNDKKKFYDYMGEKGNRNYLPKFLGMVKSKTFIGKHNIDYYLHVSKKVVVKPSSGGEGEGLYFIENVGGNIFVNGEKKNLTVFLSTLSDENYIVTEYCKQANFLSEIYPFTANTIRIWTMTPNGEEPFIPNAVLRIGTKESGFTDNRSQGGLVAEIDLKTGKLSAAAETLANGNIKWHDYHPDTGSRIKNSVIPEWDSFLNQFRDILSLMPELKYVGWDILLTEKDCEFVFIEGNSHPIPISLQVHRPLLEDPRVKKFYLENGVPV